MTSVGAGLAVTLAGLLVSCCTPPAEDVMVPPDDGVVAGVEEPAPTLAGVWESAYIGREGSWVDPNAPMARFMDSIGNPFAEMGSLPEGVRDFIAIDANDAMVASWRYDSNANTVFVGTPETDPVLGVPFVLQEDGTFLVEDLELMAGLMGMGLRVAAVADLILRPDEDGQSWIGLQQIVVTVEATEAIELDPSVAVGDKAVYATEVTIQLQPTSAPTLLFPDATWAIQVDESEANRLAPTGYVELTGPDGEYSGWDSGSEGSLAALLTETMGMPEGIFMEGARTFLLFDDDGRLLEIYRYVTAENKIIVSGPGENLFAGQAPQESPGCWSWVVSQTIPSGGPLSIEVTATLTTHEGSLAEGRQLVYDLRGAFTVTSDMPSGGDVIPAGTTATCIVVQFGTMTTSDGPFALFPGATVEPYPVSEEE
ncbi:MAG: hypothetical protein JXQ73_21045 [Phycisphaerae bacterium]|nr:hypothetical protein [Phycisphaerae bacterium]